jgi:hypothetical protein
LAVVPRAGSDPGAVMAALLDGFDVVAVDPASVRVDDRLARRLSARARSRGAVLLACPSSGRDAWPGADLELDCVDRQWFGLGQGHGRLHTQRLSVRACGRGASARPRSVDLDLAP